jgi:hypothetical protein
VQIETAIFEKQRLTKTCASLTSIDSGITNNPNDNAALLGDAE